MAHTLPNLEPRHSALPNGTASAPYGNLYAALKGPYLHLSYFFQWYHNISIIKLSRNKSEQNPDLGANKSWIETKVGWKIKLYGNKSWPNLKLDSNYNWVKIKVWKPKLGRNKVCAEAKVWWKPNFGQK